MPEKNNSVGLNDLINASEGVLNFIESISDDQYSNVVNEKWSVGQNLDHLIISIRPLNKILKKPKLSLQLMFGKSNRPSRTYDELIKKYQGKLDQGGVSTNPFLPNQTDVKKKAKMLRTFSKEYEKLNAILVKWSDKNLNTYILPHPLIGKLTIMEMMYFTIYHTSHHLKAMKISSNA